VQEARLLLSSKPLDIAQDADIVAKTAEVLELAYRKEKLEAGTGSP